MRHTVLVHTNAKHPRVEEKDGVWHVYVSAAPVDGKANEAVERLLAAHFCVPRSAVRMVRGAKSKHKIIDVQ
jgi:uncharacterized protein YggU (UPF0235/DUF167 family)